MAIPSLKLDLAPPSNFWRLNHAPLSWAALAGGFLLLAGSLVFTWQAYTLAAAAGRRTVTLVAQTSQTADAQRKVLSDLRNVDVAKELPRWRLAEKIFTERSLPWSRLTAELERSLVRDVRLKSVQRTRSSDMKVQLKVKGEARTRAAEAAFVEALQKNTFFEQVLLEREGERQGGGVEFEYTLAAQSMPPPYVPLPKQPKYGPARAAVPVASPRPPAASAPRPAPGSPVHTQAGNAYRPPVMSPAVPVQAPVFKRFTPPPPQSSQPSQDSQEAQGALMRRRLELQRRSPVNGRPIAVENQP
jgi:hypothetical protein